MSSNTVLFPSLFQDEAQTLMVESKDALAQGYSPDRPRQGSVKMG